MTILGIHRTFVTDAGYKIGPPPFSRQRARGKGLKQIDPKRTSFTQQSRGRRHF